jgi:hypothetical protein
MFYIINMEIYNELKNITEIDPVRKEELHSAKFTSISNVFINLPRLLCQVSSNNIDTFSFNGDLVIKRIYGFFRYFY